MSKSPFCSPSSPSQIIKTVSGDQHKERSFFSESLLLALARNFSMYMMLDAAKNMKSSMTNDFAIYKRYDAASLVTNIKLKNACDFLIESDEASLSKAGANRPLEDETMENQKLNIFLASRDSFSMKLRSDLHASMVGEEILLEVIERCCSLYERKVHVLPEDKHMLLRALAFALFLLVVDPEKGAKDKDKNKEKNNILKSKKVQMDRYAKIFKVR